MKKEEMKKSSVAREVYVAPKAEVLKVELDQSLLDAHASATFDEEVEDGGNIFWDVQNNG